MARKNMLADMSGDEIPEGRAATGRITSGDARKGVLEFDVPTRSPNNSAAARYPEDAGLGPLIDWEAEA